MNPDAHLSSKEVHSLICEEEEDPPVQDYTEKVDDYTDRVLRHVVAHHGHKLTKEPFAHESLLVDKQDDKLSKAEKKLAVRAFKMEKNSRVSYSRPSYSAFYPKGPPPPQLPPLLSSNGYQRGRFLPGLDPMWMPHQGGRPMVPPPLDIEAGLNGLAPPPLHGAAARLGPASSPLRPDERQRRRPSSSTASDVPHPWSLHSAAAPAADTGRVPPSASSSSESSLPSIKVSSLRRDGHRSPTPTPARLPEPGRAGPVHPASSPPLVLLQLVLPDHRHLLRRGRPLPPRSRAPTPHRPPRLAHPHGAGRAAHLAQGRTKRDGDQDSERNLSSDG